MTPAVPPLWSCRSSAVLRPLVVKWSRRSERPPLPRGQGQTPRYILLEAPVRARALGGEDLKRFERITTDPQQMGGAPCIRGLRIPVASVVDMVAENMTIEEILAAYPDLEPEDVEQALHFAAESVRERELPLRVAS
jgi:uncharacterized protein (DUF433 family)